MHPALLKLMRLRGRAYLRRVVRSVKTVRGAAIAVFTLVMFGCMFGPGLILRLTMNDSARFVGPGQTLEGLLPVGLMILSLLTALTNVRERGIYFSPAEVDFLFPAPFARRELLVYRITTSGVGALLGAAFMSAAFLIYVRSWPAAFIGLFVTLQFINLLSISSALIAQTVSEYAHSIGRRLALATAGVLVIVGSIEVISSAGDVSLVEAAKQFRHSWAGACLTAPFAVYTDLMTASELNLAFLARLLMALGINLLLLVTAIRLDTNYLEAATRVSEKVYRQLELMRRGGGFWHRSAAGKAHKRLLPRLPRWAGVGPIVQAQLTRGARTAGRWVVLAAIMGGTVAAMSVLTQEDDFAQRIFTPAVIIGFTTYVTFLASMQLPLGLRGDVDHMDWLKSLPITPLAVACGEVLGPALLISLFHFAIFVPASLVVEPSFLMLVAALCAPPINLVFFAVENLVFALYPSRPLVTTPGDFQQFGLTLAHMLLKMLLLAIAAAPVAAVGSLAWIAAGPWLAVPAMWLTTAGVAVGIVALIARAFERFDPSIDTPA